MYTGRRRVSGDSRLGRSWSLNFKAESQRKEPSRAFAPCQPFGHVRLATLVAKAADCLTPPTTVMPVQGIRTVASSRVSLESMPLLVDGLLIRRAEWRRRLHPPVQAPRLPLLRLGRQLERHEVRRLSFFPITFLSSLAVAPYLTCLPPKCLSQVKPPPSLLKITPPDRNPNIASSTQAPSYQGSLHQWPREGHLRPEPGEGASAPEGRAVNAGQWRKKQED
jgi:hypothetical protein